VLSVPTRTKRTDEIIFFTTLTDKGEPCVTSIKITLPGCQNSTRQATEADFTAASWNVSPNPAETVINCAYELKSANPANTEVSITLYNTMGKVVASQTAMGAKNTQQLDISRLPSGMYVLILQTDDGQRMHQKIIKK
jgi:hypothetical protein